MGNWWNSSKYKKITSQIEKQIFDQYNLEVKFDQDLRYDLFPKPHFLFKNTKIEYKSNNLLRIEIKSRDVSELAAEMCGPLFAKTTSAQIPVDGGNERVI